MIIPKSLSVLELAKVKIELARPIRFKCQVCGCEFDYPSGLQAAFWWICPNKDKHGRKVRSHV